MTEQAGSHEYQEHTNPGLSDQEQLDLALNSLNSNAGLDQVLDTAHIGLEDLKGKVLDIGSGSIDRFAREAGEAGIDVVSIDPHLYRPARRESVRSGEDTGISHEYPWQSKSVAGLMQNLPIQSESIGTVISTGAINYLDPEDYPQTLVEIKRVLEPDGKGYFMPLRELASTPYDQKKFLEALRVAGLSYSVQEDLTTKNEPYLVITFQKTPD